MKLSIDQQNFLTNKISRLSISPLFDEKTLVITAHLDKHNTTETTKMDIWMSYDEICELTDWLVSVKKIMERKEDLASEL